jgi:hypothetical protein
MNPETNLPASVDLVGMKPYIAQSTAALIYSLEGLNPSDYTEAQVLALYEGLAMPANETGVLAYNAFCEQNLLTTLAKNKLLLRLHLQTYLLENLNDNLYILCRGMDLALSRLNSDRAIVKVAENLHQRTQLARGGRQETFDALARVMAFLPVFNRELAERATTPKRWFNDEYFSGRGVQVLEKLPQIAAWYGELIRWYESTDKEVL